MRNQDDIADTALAVLEIDLAAYAANIRLLRAALAPGASLAGVVKANAYGIGLEEALRMHRHLGTQTFFVATLDEGIAARALLGPSAEIAVLCGLVPGTKDVFCTHRLTPVLNTLGQVAEWRGQGAGILHVDTGMRRLGLDTRETQRLLADPAALASLEIGIVMSHFACADEPGHPLTPGQYEKFCAVAKSFPRARKSLANSAGIFASPAYHFDLVRPGMATYGLNPIAGQANPMAPVVSLKTRILQIRDALPGESVGYSATFTPTIPRRVATVALGYADGFLRSLSGKGRLFWNGQPCPILGRVSMDLVTADITDLTGPLPHEGDWLEVLGPSQDADALAEIAGTIGYEILTGLGPRYHRVYSNAPASPGEFAEPQ